MAGPRLVAIVGATGTGKSELAVKLAQRFNGEVINADAMQLYEGLPIITNKIPAAEQQGIPHHLLDRIGLQEQPWVVSDFVKTGLKVIDEIHSRGRLPIVVGGTHYYTQSLLFHNALADQKSTENQDKAQTDELSSCGTKKTSSEAWPILKGTTEAMHAKLAEVDPVMAARWHPKDRRKIQRSLEIYLQTGRKASEIYEEQKTARAPDLSHGDDLGRSDLNNSMERQELTRLRIPTLALWVHAEKEQLNARLDDRVEKMLQAGLLDEVRELYAYASHHPQLDTGSGIWVSIGYKEFLPFIEYERSIVAAQEGNGNAVDGNGRAHHSNALSERFMKQAIEATQSATRQYAKRQLRWVRIKLLNAMRDCAPAESGSMYVLDASDISTFDSKVVEPAAKVVQHFLAGAEMSDPADIHPTAKELLSPPREDMRGAVGKWETQYCAACDVVGVNENDWSLHINSKRHKRTVAKVGREAKAADTRRSDGENRGDHTEHG